MHNNPISSKIIKYQLLGITMNYWFIPFSLQPLGLPAANLAYALTCSNPCAGFKFLLSKTTNTKTLKPKTLKPKTLNPKTPNPKSSGQGVIRARKSRSHVHTETFFEPYGHLRTQNDGHMYTPAIPRSHVHTGAVICARKTTVTCTHQRYHGHMYTPLLWIWGRVEW